jgi:5-methyltetrahydropteroyltriglutamate--homocysteine methyltransferase
MRRSTDRILTTHVGALERPPELAETLAEQGQWAPASLDQLRAGVADVVKRQLEVGLDVIDDGEFGKTMWSQYVRDRLDGLDNRPRSLFNDQVAKGRDRQQFPGFYSWADASKTLFGYMEDPYWLSFTATRPVVTGPIRYRPEAINRDIANLKAALAGRPDQEAFLPVVAPASIEVGMADEYHASRDDLMRALADALHQEYKAIVDAGFILQVDDAWCPLTGIAPLTTTSTPTAATPRRASKCSTTPSPASRPTGSATTCAGAAGTARTPPMSPSPTSPTSCCA